MFPIKGLLYECRKESHRKKSHRKKVMDKKSQEIKSQEKKSQEKSHNYNLCKIHSLMCVTFLSKKVIIYI